MRGPTLVTKSLFVTKLEESLSADARAFIFIYLQLDILSRFKATYLVARRRFRRRRHA